MATDLSHLLPGDPISALCPTSQGGGNEPHANNAHTAPGSAPAGLEGNMPGEVVVHPAPEISAENYDTPVVLDESGARVTADENHGRATLFTQADGSEWNSSSGARPVPQSFGRKRLVIGGWNDLT